MSAMHSVHPEGLPGRIKAFFERSPTEELTIEDARVKFDCDAQQLSDALAKLRAVKAVEVVRVIRRAA